MLGKAQTAEPQSPELKSAVSDDDDEDEASLTPALHQPKPEEAITALTQKNFRNHPDMENFFRFIYENDLRLEALQIMDEIIVERQAKKVK